MPRSHNISAVATIVLLALTAPAAAVDPDPLTVCGYHELPLVMEQRPEGSPMYFPNFDVMATINDHMDIFRYEDYDGDWGMNTVNECGGLVSNSELWDTWLNEWDTAVAMEISTHWCGYPQFCCEKIESDTAYNPAYNWLYQTSGPIGEWYGDTYSYPRIALHEMSHVWGFPPESGNFAQPTIMLFQTWEAYPDEKLMHAPDAYLLRRQYQYQTTIPTLRNLVVVSKYLHPYYLRWRKTEHLSQTPAWSGMSLEVQNLTIENSGNVDLNDVHVRFYLRPWGTAAPLRQIGDFEWGTMPAESWGTFSFFDMEIPFGVETGTYEVRVHVTMNGYQEDDRPVDSWASLVKPLEVVGRSIEVTSPTAGENHFIEDVLDITWDSEGLSESSNVWIELARNGPASWMPIAQTENTGSYTWTVYGPPCDDCLIRVTPADFYLTVQGVSDPFSIIGNYLEVEQPNGGEVLNPGTVAEIRWRAIDTGDLVDVEYNCIGIWAQVPGSPVAADAEVLAWTVPNTISSNCRVRVTSLDDPSVQDVSDDPFAVWTAGLEVTAPGAGDTVFIHAPAMISWTYDGTCEHLDVYLSRGGAPTLEHLGRVDSDTTSKTWMVGGPAQSNVRALVRDACDPNTADHSGLFQIADRTVRVTSPDGGEAWVVGDTRTITWHSNGGGDTVDLYLEHSLPNPRVDLIEAGAPNTGSYSFTIPPNFYGFDARVGVTTQHSSMSAPIEDWSDGTFEIIGPDVQIVDPTGGEQLESGEETLLTWSSTDAGDHIRLDYRVSGGSWATISGFAVNNGQYSWTVPELPNGTQIRWRVASLLYPWVEDISDGSMTIVTRDLDVYAPAGGEVYGPDDQISVRWTTSNTGHAVKITESCDQGASWRLVCSNCVNDGDYITYAYPPRREGCKLRVESKNYAWIFDDSEGTYSIGNFPPYAHYDVIAATEDLRAPVAVLANDTEPDGDDFELLAFSQPAHGRVEPAGRPGELFYYPDDDFNGEDSFLYRVVDQYGAEGSATVWITVAPVNDPPVAHDDDAEVEQGELARIEVLGNDVDVDGDPLTVVAMSTAAHGTTTYDGTVVTYQSEPGYLGEDSFSYSVMDPAGETGSATVLLIVKP